jgi:integrase
MQPHTIAIASKLDEPYSTLILFLAVSGLRISEAIGIKWVDFEGDVLHISRRIYEGKAGSTKNDQSERSFPYQGRRLLACGYSVTANGYSGLAQELHSIRATC